ncbi:LysR substrate-binding domain-containing protein [Vulcaniibacterium gelatinicum]|uniref:LysR substrate-binding domain-containing protein n=1 Tax=Vulcaniibacterium gelatinicum TaxID=2598725 RepID=UPI0011CB57BC|nr:LysR substrate-binding domain-containing protein [Vulcaniibacterium gelatinicum]
MALRADWLPALAAFEAAARHQNFAHAAEELHLTASAVSHHVRKLENRLGVMLFQRHARGVTLTAEGRQLADAAGSALADMEGVLRSLRTPREERDRVRITTLHSLTHAWLLPRLPDFHARHPQLRVVVDTEIALTRFDEGGPDLAIRHGPGHWPGLTAHLLMDDALFPVAAPALAQRLHTPADIACAPLVADLSRQGWPDWFRAADVHGAQPDVRLTFTDSTDALLAAALGLGVALARKRIVRPWLADGRLVPLPGPVLPARWSYYVVYPSHRRLRPPARSFVDWLLALEPDQD